MAAKQHVLGLIDAGRTSALAPGRMPRI